MYILNIYGYRFFILFIIWFCNWSYSFLMFSLDSIGFTPLDMPKVMKLFSIFWMFECFCSMMQYS